MEHNSRFTPLLGIAWFVHRAAEILQPRLLSQWYPRLRERREPLLDAAANCTPTLCTSCGFRDEMFHAATYNHTLHPAGPDLSRGWDAGSTPLTSSSWHLVLWLVRPENTALCFSSRPLSPTQLLTAVSVEHAAPALLIPSHVGTKINPSEENVALGREEQSGMSCKANLSFPSRDFLLRRTETRAGGCATTQ